MSERNESEALTLLARAVIVKAKETFVPADTRLIVLAYRPRADGAFVAGLGSLDDAPLTCSLLRSTAELVEAAEAQNAVPQAKA